jgi:hypothetical protein
VIYSCGLIFSDVTRGIDDDAKQVERRRYGEPQFGIDDDIGMGRSHAARQPPEPSAQPL